MAGPSELMSQEQIYLGHLEAADSYETEDDEIRLVADGLVIVTMRRAGTGDARAKRPSSVEKRGVHIPLVLRIVECSGSPRHTDPVPLGGL